MLEKYDSLFLESKTIKFWPYIGSYYDDIYPKILVLGESHYAPSAKDAEALKQINNNHNCTRETIVNEYLSDLSPSGTHWAHYVRCYRYTAAMIAGLDYHKSDFMWGYLSFYNFFQGIVGVNSKDKKYISELLENSRKAYFEVIDLLEPNFIIVWGRSKLYDWLPQDEREYINKNLLLYYYKNRPQTKIWHIQHPSRGFPYKYYNNEFISIMKYASIFSHLFSQRNRW
jgi:hypothetical protein